MNISLLLTLSFLVTAECAGGYQNCLERVWIFQSFLIDQQNPEADRKIGYQCSKWKENACEGNWVACRGRQGRPQRNFDDFQVFLGNRPPSISMTQAAYRLDGSLDSKQMATNCIWAWRDRGKPPFNFKGHKTVRDGSTGFNDLINRIGQINNDNYNKPAVRAAAGDGLFQNIDDTLTKITASRVADHGRHLIPAAKDMGPSPFYRPDYVPPPGTQPDASQWRTVDWEATIKNSPDPASTRTQVRSWLDTYYRGPEPNKSAREYWQVLRSYKTIKDRTNRCRKH
ncbi:hypothetical protein DL95DRAFT_426353 [Leptodontidium sp. 2 PMI_412]|nr:hypothetical protein DL95DRAFT_426353 [Leptodontidium sp. 2 PMI_412]